jgi:hypothetical protein
VSHERCGSRLIAVILWTVFGEHSSVSFDEILCLSVSSGTSGGSSYRLIAAFYGLLFESNTFLSYLLMRICVTLFSSTKMYYHCGTCVRLSAVVLCTVSEIDVLSSF